uniref:MARVEL domain-containing protein n=1 Tax=Phaeomonas parva TaxID=124430 RepID=A0A7S1TNM9_9STRA|mmetsp:Transcript_10600/g.32035  ORF Transcript_10600/g.32035 Transcript_10600/m.32035 type:complete len:191 (+) Transcript_10600:242-814(+)
MDLLGNAEHGKLLNVNLALQALFSFALLICSFVVAATANAGFNAVLTAILSCTFVVGAYRVLNRSQSTLAVGFVIGVSTMMSFLMLMTAVFWGQLSGCEDVKDDPDQYSCDNKKAYGATCAMSVLLFLLDVSFTILLVLWRDDFMSESSGYDDIGGNSAFVNNAPGAADANAYAAYDSSTYKVPPSSADL